MGLHPGDVLGPLQTPEIRRMNIAYMAVAMRDPNPVHTEDEFAQEAGLPGVIAHGTFPLGYAGALLTRTFGFEAIEHYRLDLTAPVFPHDVLSVRGTVRDHVDEGDGVRLVIDLEATKQDGTVVARGEATVRG